MRDEIKNVKFKQVYKYKLLFFIFIIITKSIISFIVDTYGTKVSVL